MSCIFVKILLDLQQKPWIMTFDEITEDGRLWAVRYEGENDNALYTLFDQWSDVMWLRSFFKANWRDLTSYFKLRMLIKLLKILLKIVISCKALLWIFLQVLI